MTEQTTETTETTSSRDLQLIIETPDDAFPKAVMFNFDQLAAGLDRKLTAYKGVIYENITQAKADRASLNKLTAVMDGERKRIKALCLQAYDPFAEKVELLKAKVAEVNKDIDEQIKADEAAKEKSKRAEIEMFYSANVGDLANVMPLESLFNKKWLNVSYKMATIQQEITDRIKTVTDDLRTIDTLETAFKVEVKDTYLKTFDLGAALREKSRLEERKAQLEALQAKQAEAAKPAPSPVKVAEPAPAPRMEAAPAPPLTEKTWTLSFRVFDANTAQLAALKACLTENNIKWEKI